MLNQILRRLEVPRITTRDVAPETKRSVLIAKHVGRKCQMLLSNVDYVYVSYGNSC